MQPSTVAQSSRWASELKHCPEESGAQDHLPGIGFAIQVQLNQAK
jgi:hypothetical protein